jgi:hypothetical protein
VLLADDNAGGDEGGIDDNTTQLLTSAYVLVTFLFRRAPVKNECVIPCLDEVHQDDLPLEFTGNRDLVPTR